jgi:hypothetical protein
VVPAVSVHLERDKELIMKMEAAEKHYVQESRDTHVRDRQMDSRLVNKAMQYGKCYIRPDRSLAETRRECGIKLTGC